MASRQRDDEFAVGVYERARPRQQRTGAALDERCEGGLDLAFVADIVPDELLADRLRRGLQVAALRSYARRRRATRCADTRPRASPPAAPAP
jgi:hypothetical protein